MAAGDEQAEIGDDELREGFDVLVDAVEIFFRGFADGMTVAGAHRVNDELGDELDRAPGGLMQRGEVWWVDFDERRPVLLLGDEEPSGFRAIIVVAAAPIDITGVALEVARGNVGGLPFEGVVRVALPRPGLVPCTWLTTLSRSDLLEPAGAIPLTKLDEITELLHLAGLDYAREEWA